MCHEQNPAPVDEPEEEDDAERDPHPPGVEDLAAERADPPSRHPPRDLRAGARLRHPAVAVLDLAEGDLARRGPTTPSPSSAASPCRTSRRSAASAGSASSQWATLGCARKLGDGDGSRQPARPVTGANGSSTEPPRRDPERSAPVVPCGGCRRWSVVRSCRRRRRPARAAARAPRRTPTASPAEGPELVADEVERRHEHDRDRLRGDRAEPEPRRAGTGRRGSRRARASRRRGTAAPGRRRCPCCSLNVQSRFSV